MSKERIVFDVDADQFEQRVIQKSKKKPVMVDFWAEWCAPCRSLGPVLEEVVRGYEGRVLLAKVDVDRNPELAAQHGVRGIPAVKVFHQGKVVREFTGAVPKVEVERILSGVVPGPEDELVAEGDRLLEKGKTRKAEQRYRQVLDQEPAHNGALLRLGRLMLGENRVEEGRELLARVQESAPEYTEARALLAGLGFRNTCRENGGLDACRSRVEEAPEDPEAHYNLGCCMAVEGRWEEALEELLTALTLDKNYGDGAAREAVLSIFALLGPQSDLVKPYRRRLAGVIY